MTHITIAFVGGFAVGGLAGVVAMAALVAAGNASRLEEEFRSHSQPAGRAR